MIVSHNVEVGNWTQVLQKSYCALNSWTTSPASILYIFQEHQSHPFRDGTQTKPIHLGIRHNQSGYALSASSVCVSGCSVGLWVYTLERKDRPPLPLAWLIACSRGTGWIGAFPVGLSLRPQILSLCLDAPSSIHQLCIRRVPGWQKWYLWGQDQTEKWPPYESIG